MIQRQYSKYKFKNKLCRKKKINIIIRTELKIYQNLFRKIFVEIWLIALLKEKFREKIKPSKLKS